MEIPDEIIKDLLPALEQQIENADTPFVKETLERLMSKHNMAQEEAMEFMAQALAVTINDMMISGKGFDMKVYKDLLRQLPALPDESN